MLSPNPESSVFMHICAPRHPLTKKLKPHSAALSYKPDFFVCKVMTRTTKMSHTIVLNFEQEVQEFEFNTHFDILKGMYLNELLSFFFSSNLNGQILERLRARSRHTIWDYSLVIRGSRGSCWYC